MRSRWLWGVWAIAAWSVPVTAEEYSTCQSWQEVVEATDLQYVPLIRVSDPGTDDQPAYTGFWFYDCLQFDESGRYVLGMKVSFQGRGVTPEDRGEIGYFDRQDQFEWTPIGETTAWNWQQGCRLQWRPNSTEVLWNDRAEDGSRFVCRAYDFRTGASRTLPRPIYDVSPDGRLALTHDFQRMKHGGTAYVGIPEPYAGERAPTETGIDKMDLDSGEVELLVSLKRMAEVAFPKGYKAESDLYFFREGWNPSGTRFITFLKNSTRPVYSKAWSISADGRDIRFFYDRPSHHTWQDDSVILEGRGLRLFRDDGTGEVVGRLTEFDANADPTILPCGGGAWVLGDTYVLDGFQHLFLFHRPSGLFVPLAKLKNTAAERGIHRVDLHARCSRDGMTVCIDSSHEGMGRQMYLASIAHIINNPPTSSSKP